MKYCVDVVGLPDDSETSDIVGSMFSLSLAAGMFIGPPLSGLIAQLFGIIPSFELLGLLLLLFTLAFPLLRSSVRSSLGAVYAQLPQQAL
jgi:hypothetical protein